MLVVALFQVSGRLLFQLLDELELPANQWLSGQQIKLTGLHGGWRGLNPVVRIDRIDFPSGYVAGIHLEVDWVESLIRNRLVAQRLSISDGYLILEQTQTGWRLLGAKGESSFDPSQFLYHSDQLTLAARLGFITKEMDTPGFASDIALRYEAANRGGIHRHRLVVENSPEQCVGACSVRLELDLTEKIAFLRPPTQVFRAVVDDFTIPKALLGFSAARIESLVADWQRVADDSGGRLSLAFAELALPGGETLRGGVSVAARGLAGTHHAQLSEVHLVRRDEHWALPPLWVRFADGLAEFWTAELDLGEGSAFFANGLPFEHAAGRWLRSLALRGEALNVRGYVRLAPLQIGYAATIANLDLNGHRGAPYTRGAAGELMGHAHGAQIQVNAHAMALWFPDTFSERWLLDNCQGLVQAWFGHDYFGIRGRNLRVELDGTRAAGGFAISRPPEEYEQLLSLLINIDQTSVQRAKSYVPKKLPAGLPEWLDQGPQSGLLSDVKFAYHGQIHTRPFELARRIEFNSRITDGHVQYHPDWPHVFELDGEIAVAGRKVVIVVDRGLMNESRIDGSRVVLHDNARYADVELQTTMAVAKALHFVRSTPLAQWMNFITPDWSGAGNLSLTGSMHVPLKLGGEGEHIGEPSQTEALALDLQIALVDVDLELPAYRVNLTKMNGELVYQYPINLVGEGIRGEIFGYPAVFASRADDDTVVFTVAGQASHRDVLELLNLRDPGVMEGGFDFIADLHVELGEEEITRLEVVSDLVGLALDLPGEYRKLAEQSRTTEIDLRFLDDYQAFSFRHGDASGWLHVSEAPLRGAIGFSTSPPMVDTSAHELVLSGRIESFALEEVIPDNTTVMELAIPIRLASLQVANIDVAALQFNDAVLDGRIAQDELEITIASPKLNGTITLKGDDPLQLLFSDVLLPAGSGEGDPLDTSVIANLPRADVVVEHFAVGEADYGRWAFKLIPEPAGVRLAELTARVREVDIVAPDGLFWRADNNRSYFEGTMSMGNLEEVLPLWGYAPSVSTKHAELTASFEWRGSPANVDLERLVGQAVFQAEDGRFSEIESGTGAMRILSLVNFSTLGKRLNFDFSDVTGEGLSFDTLVGTARFDEGSLTFIEPMEVEGSGSKIRIGGSVDLESGALNNEMVVTLPVNKSLPWYAAWVALANPLAGVGVLIGERVLRKPIEQFSSAKYVVTGTLDAPNVDFVTVWDTSLNKPQAVKASVDDASGEGESDEGGAASKAEKIVEDASADLPGDGTRESESGTTTAAIPAASLSPLTGSRND